MLREYQLFGYVDLVEKVIARFREFEKQAISMNPDGYWVAFSGGKDSIVLKDLFLKSGVKGKLHFNLTSVDPPELTQYIKTHHKDVVWHRPQKHMFRLIKEKMMPPTRIVRYCCEKLKECGGRNSFVVTGVRWAESVKRSKRKMTEVCFRDSRKRYLNPIIEWTDDDVWQYIRENKLPYCCLYDEGFKRIGCVGCPIAGDGRLKEFARWPRFEKAYRKAFAAAAAARLRFGNTYGNTIAIGDEINTGDFDDDDDPITRPATQEDVDEYAKNRKKLRWSDGDAMWDWWIKEDRTKPEDSDQGVLFE